MTEVETNILRLVAVGALNLAAPVLLERKHCAVADKLADSGLLRQVGAVGQLGNSYALTDSGKEKYINACPSSEPVVKAWGKSAPATLRKKVKFIKKIAKPMSDAYFMEIELKNGDWEHWTLSEEALEAKKKEHGYDPYDDYNDDRIYISCEFDESICYCDVTGEPLCGSWSGEPEALCYALTGFAWRREERFQMDDADWQEAEAFLARINPKESKKHKRLFRLIAESCFLEPCAKNDTGMHNPGACSIDDIDGLIDLFDFMRGVSPC